MTLIIQILLIVGIIGVVIGGVWLYDAIKDSEIADKFIAITCIVCGITMVVCALCLIKTDTCQCDSTCITCNEVTQ
jgi:undecaprenyl pyrophosphate phosphatase UppP